VGSATGSSEATDIGAHDTVLAAEDPRASGR